MSIPNTFPLIAEPIELDDIVDSEQLSRVKKERAREAFFKPEPKTVSLGNRETFRRQCRRTGRTLHKLLGGSPQECFCYPAKHRLYAGSDLGLIDFFVCVTKRLHPNGPGMTLGSVASSPDQKFLAPRGLLRGSLHLPLHPKLTKKFPLFTRPTDEGEWQYVGHYQADKIFHEGQCGLPAHRGRELTEVEITFKDLPAETQEEWVKASLEKMWSCSLQIFIFAVALPSVAGLQLTDMLTGEMRSELIPAEIEAVSEIIRADVGLRELLTQESSLDKPGMQRFYDKIPEDIKKDWAIKFLMSGE